MARWLSFLLAAGLLAAGFPAPGLAEELSLSLPAVKTSINFGDQPVTIAAAAVITGHPDALQDIFRLLVTPI